MKNVKRVDVYKMTRSAFLPADILVPTVGDMESWSVIACDQFTSELDYWEKVKAQVGGKFSTFNMIMPEVYLNSISAIDMAVSTGNVMEKYLDANIFETLENSFIYVERQVDGGIRRGLVGVIDLDKYDYKPDSASPVRASERTVAERLPARMLIRENAALELPHIMVLIDDEARTVVEPLSKCKTEMRKLYDFELMENGGNIKGWQVTGEIAEKVNLALDELAKREVQIVIGDGNHSLAAAKELWEKMKQMLTPEELENHPARYALCELNNVYDNGIEFEPIHRVIFNICPAKLLEVMKEKICAQDGHEISCVVKGKVIDTLKVHGKSFGKMIDVLQEFLEEYAAVCDGTVDYIHDEDAVMRLTNEEGSVGFLLPGMAKKDLFKTVIQDGVFPKKSFSIGHAKDKRYYLECRKIRKP